MSAEVVKYDVACRAVAACRTLDDVRDWSNKADAIREYARRAKNRSMEIDAAEIRIRSERRRGELLREMRDAGTLKEGRPKKNGHSEMTVSLQDLDTTKNESSRAQSLAAHDGDSFERLVARWRAHQEIEAERVSLEIDDGEEKKRRREQREVALGAVQCALPEQKFGIIYADPEWRFEPYSRDSGMDRAADNHYPTSVTEAICARPVASIAAKDCVLFLWATVPMLPDALKVMAAWGFTYKSHCIWTKDKIGTGYWFRNAHELLLVGTKGNIPAPAMGTQFPSTIEGRVTKHSAKPECFYELIEQYFPSLPKIELNARAARDGWTSWGNEAPVTPDLPPHDPETGEIIETKEVNP